MLQHNASAVVLSIATVVSFTVWGRRCCDTEICEACLWFRIFFLLLMQCCCIVRNVFGMPLNLCREKKNPTRFFETPLCSARQQTTDSSAAFCSAAWFDLLQPNFAVFEAAIFLLIAIHFNYILPIPIWHPTQQTDRERERDRQTGTLEQTKFLKKNLFFLLPGDPRSQMGPLKTDQRVRM